MDKRYSTIRLSGATAHIFDHKSGKTLCGRDRWQHTPFKLNKSSFDGEEMLKRHKAFAERRGEPNPYKFTCKRCEQILKN